MHNDAQAIQPSAKLAHRSTWLDSSAGVAAGSVVASAPPGWPLWVSDPSANRRPLIIGGIVVGAVAIIVAVILVLALGGGPKLSDEDQIRAVQTTIQDAYNRSDVSTLRQNVCQKRQKRLDNFKASSDHASLTLKSVTVNGDSAEAKDVEDWGAGNGPHDDTYRFVRENGSWKSCDGVP
jgi:hypothetical protein